MGEWIVLAWLVAFAVLTAVGAPLAAAAFRDLPRKGAALALPSALIPFALLVFWIGQVTFGRLAVFGSLLVVLACSAVAYRRGHRPEWRAVAGGYLVFVAGFALLVVFRAYDAGITPAGGEQFLHFGLVKALLRAEALPPEDFWFAGEPLRYYYGTQMQVAAFSILTDTPARYGFNLGIAAFYGVLVVTAYGLVGAVTAAAGRSYRLGGTLGAFFVAVGGSLTTSVRLGFGLLPRDVALRFGGPAFGAVRHMPYEEAVTTLSTPSGWGWFFTRYVVPRTLQEFPLYSFVKADLHGHALSTGYVVFAAALAFAYYRTPGEERARRAAIVYGGLGSVAGVFGFMNTWSLPTAVGLAALALAAADPHPATLFPDRIARRILPGDGTGLDSGDGTGRTDGGSPDATGRGTLARLGAEAWRAALAGALSAGVGVVGVALASPFLIFGHVPENDGIGLFPPRTALAPFLVIYGGILALFAGFLLYRGWPAARGWSIRAKVGIAAALLVGWVVLALVRFPVLAVTGPILLAAWWLVRTDRAGFEAVVLVAGVGLVLSMDLVYAKVAPEGLVRWNTTLKVAVQGWTLAGAAAGAVAALLLADARDALASYHEAATDPGPDRRSVAASALTGALVVGVVLTATPFAALTFEHQVRASVADEDPTLDGIAVHEGWRGEQMEAIYWLDGREGTPTVLEAPGREPYQWTNPAATLTGLPTPAGWLDHQDNYRDEAVVQRRAAQVDAIYAGNWSRAASLLREHDVEYVYVGPRERTQYGIDLREFDDRAAFSVAFDNAAVTVYRVNHSRLPDGE
ncbi:hypothetical protein BRD00_05555 [Halobacteriales archaeon QS_8_69_26]|nr:MAG: hypothetical protein BRD00_05555 [Halobacteriales archaeon QS_8_69_26]